MANPLIFLIVNIPINFQLDRNSLRSNAMIGQAALLIGSMLRLLINFNPYFLLIGQILIAVGNCYVGQMIPKISALWFHPDHRVFATSIMSSSYMLGNSLGFFLNSLYIQPSSQPVHIFQLFLVVCIINFSIFLFFYFYF